MKAFAYHIALRSDLERLRNAQIVSSTQIAAELAGVEGGVKEVTALGKKISAISNEHDAAARFDFHLEVLRQVLVAGGHETLNALLTGTPFCAVPRVENVCAAESVGLSAFASLNGLLSAAQEEVAKARENDHVIDMKEAHRITRVLEAIARQVAGMKQGVERESGAVDISALNRKTA